MKKRRERRPGFQYPWGVMGSLKGDQCACLRYILARNSRTRRSRRKWLQWGMQVMAREVKS